MHGGGWTLEPEALADKWAWAPQSALATARSAVGLVLRFITSGAMSKLCPHQLDWLPHTGGRAPKRQPNGIAHHTGPWLRVAVACCTGDGDTLN